MKDYMGWDNIMTNKDIGQQLIKQRNKYNYTQLELAHKLNLKRQTLSAYETGHTLPNIFVLVNIANIYNISLDELIGRKSEK